MRIRVNVRAGLQVSERYSTAAIAEQTSFQIFHDSRSDLLEAVGEAKQRNAHSKFGPDPGLHAFQTGAIPSKLLLPSLGPRRASGNRTARLSACSTGDQLHSPYS